jgi:hypothetical protein
MIAFFYTLLKYFFSWLVMFASFFLALLAESIYIFLSAGGAGSDKRGLHTFMLHMRSFVRSINVKMVLPESACETAAVYFPGLALAAIIPISASIPLSTLVPILDNGGDMVQILLFGILSEVFALISVYSLGTYGSWITAQRMIKEQISFMLPLMACFASIAAFLAVADGTQGDSFSLNAFAHSLFLNSLHWYGIIGIAIFVFVIFSQIPHSTAGLGCLLLETGELPEYQGCPRVVLQMWSFFRAFTIIALVTHIFFPWGYFKGLNAGFSISWWAQSMNFFGFWLFVVLVRVFGVTLCWKGMRYLEKTFPRVPDFIIVSSLTFAAMLLVICEIVKISMEVSEF